MEVKEILKEAVNKDASDIFFIAGSPYAFKLNGAVEKVGKERLMPGDCDNLIHQLYELSSYANYQSFIEQGDDDFSISISDIGRFRVNTYRQRNSQAAVLRVVKSMIPNPEALQIPSQVIDLYKEKKGMILITGPAGSGKSTTLACIIDKINETRPAHIITIEDPIEYLHRHKSGIVSQREVLHDTKGYLPALRAALRETPEVILLGEMRDSETIETALTAAETGHLLLSTLHTVGAVNTIDRIVDSFSNNQAMIRSQLSMVLHAVISEQLIPDVNGKMIPVFEIMKVNTAIRSQIRDGKLHQIENTMNACRNEGMITMDEALLSLYKEKRITSQTALTYCTHYDVMERKLKG